MGEKPNFSGKWVLEYQENFDAFMGEMGVPWIARKLMKLDKPSITIEQDGDDFKMKMETKIKTFDENFTVGKEFEQTRPNGDVVIVKPSWEGEKLVWDISPKGGASGKTQRHTRYIEGDTLIQEMVVGDIKAKRIFKKVKIN